MSDKKGPVPDFTSWRFVKQSSFFYVPGQKDFAERDAAEGDGENPFWCGHFSEYIDPTGSAEGREYDFFGYGAVLKCWRLLEEDYSSYAVSRGNHWEYFPRKTHAVYINPQGIKKNNTAIGILACVVRVVLNDTELEILSVTVARDLLGLPPIK